MPELPDLVYIQKKLAATLPQNCITKVSIKEPVVLRILVPDKFDEALKGARFERVIRHGPFLNFRFHNELALVVHPMLAGRFKYAEADKKLGRGLCFTFELNNGARLHYLDDRKMGKVYLIHADETGAIPRYRQQGVDILSGEFTLERFQSLIKGQRKQVRVFLMDQTLLSAIGNAYADEILFDARLHPKTLCHQLSPEEWRRLYESIDRVINWGIEEVEKAQQPIEVKVRDHMKVRNRKDEPCPRCGTTIRRAGVLGVDAFFCPTCQPPRRQQFINWT